MDNSLLISTDTLMNAQSATGDLIQFNYRVEFLKFKWSEVLGHCYDWFCYNCWIFIHFCLNYISHKIFLIETFIKSLHVDFITNIALLFTVLDLISLLAFVLKLSQIS